MNSFYTKEELHDLGFKKLGENIKISRKASIYGAENMSIDSDVRIDDFCLLSGNIILGQYVHIAAYSCLFAGNAGIKVEKFAGVSSRCSIYAESDDYSGTALAHPTVPMIYRDVTRKKVILEKHSIIGTNSTILPGVVIGEGVAVGSMSLVNKNLEAWYIYAGIPAHKVKKRSKELLKLEALFVNEKGEFYG